MVLACLGALFLACLQAYLLASGLTVGIRVRAVALRLSALAGLDCVEPAVRSAAPAVR